MKDPLVLWVKLQECFGKQKAVLLPQARLDWAQLRFLDFKTAEAYNTAIHRIVAQLRFCVQVVTELDMIEKTLETFHPTNMVLQQQYRNKYMKYCDLINVLLAVEAQNELLMKNFHMRPVGTQAHPEAHASFRNSNGKGSFRNKGQKFHGHQGQKGGKFKNKG